MWLLQYMLPHLEQLAGSAAVVSGYALIEHKWPARSDQKTGNRLTNYLIGVIVALAGLLLSVLFEQIRDFIPADGLFGVVVPGWRPPGLAGLFVSILAYGFVWDFFQYWFHRSQHNLAVLWPMHRVHHSDGAVNASTALRRSVPELVLIFFCVFLPTAVVAGIDAGAAYGAFILFFGWGFFNHANIRLPLGRFTPVVSGPQWHRLHHGLEPRLRNCNYAAYFPILDILFGTYRAPRAGDFPPTGINDPIAQSRPMQDCLLPVDT